MSLVFEDEILQTVWKLPLLIDLVKVSGGVLRVIGHFGGSAASYLDDFGFYALVNRRDRIAVPMYDSSYSYRGGRMKYCQVRGFDFEIPFPFADILSFEAEYKGQAIGVRLQYWAPHLSIIPGIKRSFVVDGSYAVVASGDELFLRALNAGPVCDRRSTYAFYVGI